MKRPQFSLRLMLLVVALCATIFAWRRAVWEKERADKIMQLEAEVDSIEQSLEGARQHYHLRPGDPFPHLSGGSLVEFGAEQKRQEIEALKH